MSRISVFSATTGKNFMQIAYYLSKLWKNKRGSFYETPCKSYLTSLPNDSIIWVVNTCAGQTEDGGWSGHWSDISLTLLSRIDWTSAVGTAGVINPRHLGGSCIVLSLAKQLWSSTYIQKKLITNKNRKSSGGFRPGPGSTGPQFCFSPPVS